MHSSLAPRTRRLRSALEPGDEQHASFRITDWTLKSGRLYLGLDQLPAFDVPERGGSMSIAISLPGGESGALRLNNIDLSATTRELRLLFSDASMRRWLVENASSGDVLRLDFQAADQASASIIASQGAGAARRRLLVPVRADWNDSRGLLGFWNPIFDRYERTDLIDLLLRAADDLEHPYFVILDEMNLARVEYYFSDFLSAMESGEPIPLHSDDALDETVPASLQLPPNVFVVGTVNIDETTHAFSPKVLDRASVIEFNDVLILTPSAAPTKRCRKEASASTTRRCGQRPSGPPKALPDGRSKPNLSSQGRPTRNDSSTSTPCSSVTTSTSATASSTKSPLSSRSRASASETTRPVWRPPSTWLSARRFSRS